jgi:glycosyltransferase involved in cell wall biosynthesis
MRLNDLLVVEKPQLSAIVPSHNGDRWLAATLQSVVDQEDGRIEVIVVDSSDSSNSLEIVNRFSDELAIRAYRRPDLPSWMEKTNFGVGVARADWICMLHQDDLWLPNRCSEVANRLAARSDSVMHLHSAKIIDESGKRLGTWRCPLPGGAAPVPAQILLERLIVQNFVAIPTPTIRRDAYLKVGGLDEQLWYTADWDLYLKLLAVGEVYYHPDTLACFRIHGNSLTMAGSRSLDEFRSQMETVVDRHIGKLGARQKETLRMAMTSIDVNVALAAASRGQPARLIKAIATLFGLGPRGMRRYFQYSRIIERAYPRLRARLAGAL